MSHPPTPEENKNLTPLSSNPDERNPYLKIDCSKDDIFPNERYKYTEMFIRYSYYID